MSFKIHSLHCFYNNNVESFFCVATGNCELSLVKYPFKYFVFIFSGLFIFLACKSCLHAVGVSLSLCMVLQILFHLSPVLFS